MINLSPCVPMQTCHSINACIPYIVHDTPVTCLFYYWEFVPLNPVHLCHPSPPLPSLVSCICESVSVLLVFFFGFSI